MASLKASQDHRIINDIEGCIKDLKHEFQETGLPITDDCTALHRFCAKLEYILQNDQRERALFTKGKDYWNYFYNCLSKVKGSREGLKFVKSINELKTSLGRGRAFIRFCLVQHQLADTLQQCVSNTKITSDWFYETSVLRQRAMIGLISTLYDVNEIQFDLSPMGYDLDNSWPSFARKSFSMPYTWKITERSRSTSISSLNSIVSQLSNPFTSPEGDKKLSLSPKVNNLQDKLFKSESAKLNLELHIEELEKEKDELQQQVIECTADLTCAKESLHNKDHELELENLNYNKELKMKEIEWNSKESNLKLLLDQSETMANELRERIQLMSMQQKSETDLFAEKQKHLEDQISILEISNSEQAVEISRLMTEIDERNEENKNWINEKQVESIHLDSIEKEKHQTENENLNLKDQIYSLEEHLHIKTAEVETLKQKLEISNQMLESQYQSFSALQNQMDLLTTGHSEESVTECEANLNHMQIPIEDLQKDLAELKIRLLETEKQLDEKEQAVILATEQVHHSREELNIARTMMQQELSALQFQRSSESMLYESALTSYANHEEDISNMKEKISEQEQEIIDLQEQLNEILEKRNEEKEQQHYTVEELSQILSTRDEECTQLNEDLKKSTKLLDEEKKTSQALQVEFNKLKSTFESSITDLKTDNTQLTRDSLQLKKKVIELIKVKDNLWQKSDYLEHLQRLKSSERWLDDKEVTHCFGCKSEFTFLLRKHHCRLCGRIFCYQCASNWIMTAASSKQLRICQECFINQSQTGDISSASLLECSVDVDAENELITVKPREIARNSLSEELEKGSKIEENTQGTDSLSPEDHIKGGDEEVAESETIENKSLDSDFAATTRDLTSNVAEVDDDFHIIDDDEIARSLSGSNPYQFASSESQTSLMLSVEEVQENENTEERQVWIYAGKSFSVSVTVSEPGVILSWSFRTEPKSIAFAVEYEDPKAEGGDVAYDMLVPKARCTSHKQTIQGQLEAYRPGIYKFIFDNSFSRFTTKKLAYRLTKIEPSYDTEDIERAFS